MIAKGKSKCAFCGKLMKSTEGINYNRNIICYLCATTPVY